MKTIVAYMFGLCLAAQSLAGTVVCSGTVTRISYHTNNQVMLQLSSMNTPVFICSPETDWTVPGASWHMGPSMCKTLVALLLTAKATGTPVSNVYFDGDAAPASCDTWATWQSASVRYFDYY